MRWTRGYRSAQVEDRRALRGAGIGGASALLWLFSRFGLPGLLIGGVLLYFMDGLGTQSTSTSTEDTQRLAEPRADSEQEAVEFVSFVLDDVQNTWNQVFEAGGQRYPLARLVLFRGQTSSACGAGSALSGPFYCPGDQRVYIDLGFYRELKQRFGAPGDFAQAYVIAHEIGHHVQHLLGQTERMQSALGGKREGSGGASVRLELQADCLAGVWAHSTRRRNLLDAGDVEEALGAAAAIGDDRLQRSASGTVSPETWTHGSSQQRVHWFRQGFTQGKTEACDTLSSAAP